MLKVSHLTRRYGAMLAVNNVSFTIQPGEIVGLLGHNGAGKTSLLRGLCGLSPLSQGLVRWCGLPVVQARETFLSDVFFLGHALGLKDELSALENLQAAQAIAGRPVRMQQALARHK